MVGYTEKSMKSGERLSKVSFASDYNENNNNNNDIAAIERLLSGFSKLSLSQKLAQQLISKNGKNNFGNRNNNNPSLSHSDIHIPSPSNKIGGEGQSGTRIAAKKNGSRYQAYFDPRSDLSSTEKLDLFLDKYEEDHGFEPVNLDTVATDILPKIAALEELLAKGTSVCTEICNQQQQEMISIQPPFSSLDLSNRTAETVIGQDEGDNNGKVNSKSQPLAQIKDESIIMNMKTSQMSVAPTPTISWHERKDKTSSTIANDTSALQTVQNIDTQQKKSSEVNNTEVARNNKNCDKKTSDLLDSTHTAGTSKVITSPQRRPPPHHIDNSLRRENYGGAATTITPTTTGNRSEQGIYDEIVRNPPGKFQNNQNLSQSQGEKITSASALSKQQRPPPGPEFAKDKIDSHNQQQQQKPSKIPLPSSTGTPPQSTSINSESEGRADHANLNRSKIPVLLPKTRENTSLSQKDVEASTSLKPKTVKTVFLWKSSELPIIYEEGCVEKSAKNSPQIPNRPSAVAGGDNALQQVRYQPKPEVNLNNCDQDNNNSIRMSPENYRLLSRISPGNHVNSVPTRSRSVPDANKNKQVVPFKTKSSGISRLAHYDNPDEISACLDLIDGLSFHTNWVMNKVLEFPVTERDAAERVRRIKECPEVGEFFGVPYVKSELLGHWYFTKR